MSTNGVPATDKASSPARQESQAEFLERLKHTWQSVVKRREFAALVLLFVFSTLLGLQTDTFFTSNNLSNVARAFSWIAIAAFGESVVIIIGGIDLSVGTVMALAGLISALCLQAGLPVPVAVVAGLLSGGLVGWINGTVIGRVRLPPFMVTLGTASIVRGIALGLTGGWPVRDLPQGFRLLGQGNLYLFSHVLPVTILFTLVMAILITLLLRYTVLGSHIYVLGNSERALLISGVDVVHVKTLVYALCGLLAATGGILMTARLGVATPTSAVGYELDIIAAAVLGGTSLFGGEGSIPGVFLGAAVMQILRNGLVLLGFPAYWQTAAIGVIILGAILVDYWQRQRQA